MNRLKLKAKNLALRKNRIRSIVKGTEARPRLSVKVSNVHVTAQIINDVTGATLLHATSVGSKTKATMTEKATTVGTELAKKAKKAKVEMVVFDRNGKKYHGRIKALADAARQEGLSF
jgi:large subunit ribosomal protein L18